MVNDSVFTSPTPMSRAEFGRKYAGKCCYALVTRGGGYRTIHKLVTYRVEPSGAMLHHSDVLGCVANKAQYEWLDEITAGHGYYDGRPSFDWLMRAKANLDRLLWDIKDTPSDS